MSSPIISSQDGNRMAGAANFGGKKAAPFVKGGGRAKVNPKTGKKWTAASDSADDIKNGVKLGSAKDKALDKKRGVPTKPTAAALKAQAKAMVKANMDAGNKGNDSDTRKLPPPVSKKERKRESLNFTYKGQPVNLYDLSVLSTKARKSLPATDFVVPGKRKYPIPDKRHAANALARSAGKPIHAAVVKAVQKKFGKGK